MENNGGPTQTHALLAGSPAIDAGANCPDTDQRGVTRPQGSHCDIGAYEYEGTWVNVGPAGFSDADTYYVSLVVDNSGMPYVAYMDGGHSLLGTMKKYDGSNWVTVGSTNFSLNMVDYVSLALDSSDIPFVAYRDGSNGLRATVAKFDGLSWVAVGSAGFSATTADFISLAIDSSDTPFVAFKDGNHIGEGKATVMKFDGSNWVTVGSAGFSTDIVTDISLAIDSSDTPIVAYKDGGNNNKVTVMKFDGSSWVTVGSAGLSAGPADFISLAIDSNDTPIVAYKDSGNNNKATVMKFNGSSWVIVGSAGLSAGSADFISLAIDDNDTPFVAYKDGSKNGKATVMKFNGSNWVTVGSAGFSADEAADTSLAIDNNNTLHVAYVDYSKGNKTTVMKFETPHSNPNLAVTNSPITYNGAAQSANVEVDVTGVVDAIYYDDACTVTTTPINAGNYNIYVDFTPYDTGRYNILTCSFAGTFSIDKADPSLSVSNSPVTYNNLPQSAIIEADVAGGVSNVNYDNSSSVPTDAGIYSINADFVPHDTINYNSLTNTPIGQFIIEKAGTITTITLDTPDPSSNSATITINFTVTALTGIPNGLMDITDGATTLCSAVPVVALSCSTTLNGSGVHTLTATYNGDANFNASSDTEYHTVKSNLTFTSTAIQDGRILESSETSGYGGTMNSTATLLYLGDNAQKKQYRSVLSYNTSSLPDNAVITKVTLKLKKQGITGGGNPVSMFQGFVMDVKKGFFGTASLALTDFKAAAHKTVGPQSPALTSGWYNLNLTPAKAYINKLATNSGLSQIRLRFKLDDNNNAVANYLKLYSGNAAASNRPQLIVEYYVP